MSTSATIDSFFYDTIANSVTTSNWTFINSYYTRNSTDTKYFDNQGQLISMRHIGTDPNFIIDYYYFYFPNNLLEYSYKIIPSLPNDSILTQYSYDAFLNLIMTEEFVWNNGAIESPIRKKLQYFDNQNQLIGYNWYSWIDSTIGYDPCGGDSAMYTYNGSGKLLSEFYISCGTGDGGITFWYVYNANGELDSTYWVSVSHLQDTSFQYCGASIGQLINTIHTVSSYKDLSLYPNPSTGRIYLSGMNTLIDQPEIKVYDLLGKELLYQKMIRSGSLFEADLTQLHAGIYVISVPELSNKVIKVVISN
jgi:hypothetical protein